MHQRIAVPGVDAREVARVVARGRHRPDQRDRRRRRVQADRVADPGVLGRVRREHQDDLLVGVRDAAQHGVLRRDPGDPRGALEVRHVDRQAVGVGLLERERDRDQPAVELGDGDLGRDVERGQPVVACLPGGARAGEAQALQDRDVERGQLGDVPLLVLAAGLRGRRLRAARGEHGDDHRVRRAQRLQKPGRGLAQRRAPDRQRARALLDDRVAERLDVAGVPGEVLRPVEQHGHGGPVVHRLGVLEDPPLRQRDGRLEPLAGEQHRVGEEGVQLRQVVGAALRQVGVRLGRDPRRRRGQLHHLGVRRHLPAQADQRRRAGPEQVQPLLEVPVPAEHPDDDDVRLVGHRREIVVRDPVRVREPVVGPGGAGREQVGIRGGQEQDHRGVTRRSARGAGIDGVWARDIGGPSSGSSSRVEVDPTGRSGLRGRAGGGSVWLARPGPGSQWRDRAGLAPASWTHPPMYVSAHCLWRRDRASSEGARHRR